MQRKFTYHIVVSGNVETRVFAAAGPIHVRADPRRGDSTRLIVDTDQSGLIGLLRFIHQQGLELTSLRKIRG